MDFSKEYILMCEKAEEIQKIAKGHTDKGVGIESNNFYAHKDGYEIDMTNYVYNCTIEGYALRGETKDEQFGCAVDKREKIYEANEIVWLPSQDQLQEIISTKQFFENLDHQAIQFNNFCAWFEESKNRQFFSFEQLWLAFVMKEKFQKVWQNNEWIVT